MAPPGVLIDHRLVSAGDEFALLPAEAVSFRRSVPAVRRRSGAARRVARGLLAEFGVHDFALVRAAAGGLAWPLGYLGSVSHDEDVAVAVVAKTCGYAALGVDVEPALALPAEIRWLVATPTERQHYSDEVLSSRTLFVVKEAVFKAVYPRDGAFLDFQDIEVDLAAGCARFGNGDMISIAIATCPRVIAIAFAHQEKIGRP